MMLRGRLIGGLSFGGPTREFPVNQISIAEEVARQMAIVIDHARLLEQLRRRTAQLEAHVQALGESEERYRLVTENIHDAIFLVDLEGHFTFATRRFEQLTGYSLADLRGRPVSMVLTPEGRAVADARRQAGLAGHDAPSVYETELARRDGTRIWVEVNSTDVVEDGRTIARLAAARDITMRKHSEAALESSEARFRAIFEQMGRQGLEPWTR